ncbi:iron ABC transporter substrate-binding protein [Acetohalobium arabaticum]|uniref:Periplasmic binding protein n=1 Tax=Acetohalobium arabaticum (strain ATCC 49924 / DSM 5501 / Z-7288) TaxID=574087 RepID=D9QVR6_ACEAZ|nr:iron ABC transporter substrate-binding protein [Acetohalobium arabaticum]ADL12325.1 periplasmic binding protein [Acetohalobium arabaticum DSM 5501]
MNKIKQYGIVVMMLALLLVVGGCAGQQAEEKIETVKIEDMVGREVEVPKEVDKTIGVGAGALRLITYLEATDKVVGVEQFEKRDQNRPYIMGHPELTELPSIGPIHGGDAELIAAQSPDVIFATYTDGSTADSLQEKTGIPVVVLSYGGPSTMERDTYYKGLKLMAEVLNKEDRAEELIQYTEDVIDDLQQRTEDIAKADKPKVYAGGIGQRGSHGIVSTEPAYPSFEFINANNVASPLGMEHAMVSKEKLLEWDPEIIFVDEGGYSLVVEDLKSPEYESISAVENGELYGVLPYNYYTTNFETVLINSYYMGKIIYPEQFSDIASEKKADKIYEKFVGAPVYDQMQEAFGGYKRIDLQQAIKEVENK